MGDYMIGVLILFVIWLGILVWIEVQNIKDSYFTGLKWRIILVFNTICCVLLLVLIFLIAGDLLK
jgi:hypothetical protein